MSLDLKKIFGDDLAAKLDEAELMSSVKEKLQDAKVIQNNEGEFIPQSKFSEKVNALNAQIDELNSQLEQRSKDVEDFEKKVKAGEDATKALSEMKEKHLAETGELQTKLKATEIESAVNLALVNAKIKRPEWASHLVKDIMEHSDKFIKLENGKYSGIDDLVKEKKESEVYKEWFGEIKVNGKAPGTGEADDGLLFEGKKAADMTLTDRLVLKKADSEKFGKMFPDE